MQTQIIFLTGLGFDVHPLQKTDQENHLMLSGIRVPCCYKVIAHSDGDVVLHALVDALLGAIAAGDIGEHFPPSDPQWKDADSTLFLKHVLKLYKTKQASIVNIDVTVICEAPKVNPHKLAMKSKLSELTGLQLDRINIKATTTEKLGFLGRSEGIAAQAIVSVKLTETI